MPSSTYIVFAPDMVPPRAILCTADEQSASLSYGRFVFGKDQILMSSRFCPCCSIYILISANMTEEKANHLLDFGYVELSPENVDQYFQHIMADTCGEY